MKSPCHFGPFSEGSWSHVQPWEARLVEAVDQLEPDLVRLRRHLHAHPEPSGYEIETTQFLRRHLHEAGLAPRTCRSDAGAETGIVADLTLGTPRDDAPRIALRADIDALRMADEKTVDYRSRNAELCHACGHDVHTTMVLGVALAAARLAADSPTAAPEPGLRLRFLFQPAEETSGGAEWLVAQGAVDGVDAVLGVHVDPERLVGQVGIRYGVLTANCDEVEILVEGHGGHAARPHHSTDPIAAAAHLVSTLYEFLPRSVDSRSASVFTVGTIHGGYAANVIPERVELRGTLRTTDADARERLKTRIQKVCAAAELSSGARVTARFLSPLKSVNNDPQVASALEAASRRVLGSDGVALIDRPSMGGEDFSVYLDHVPGAQLRIGCAAPGARAPFLHSPLFDVDERVIGLGTRILLEAALLLATGSR